MSKAREEYERQKTYCDNVHGGFIPEITNYIKELEDQIELSEEDKKSFISECNNLRSEKIKLKKENKEMLECLLDCYNDMKNDCSACSKCVAHYSIWHFIERKVKKITGKPIEEVFKDE